MLRQLSHSERRAPGRTRLAFILLWVLISSFPLVCRAEGLDVLILLSDNSAPYQSFASSLNRNLPASVRTVIAEQPEKFTSPKHTDLIVAVGMKAALAAMTQTEFPVLATMITRAGYEELRAQSSPSKHAQAISVLYLDQPISLQLDFIQAILPTHRRIGLLYTPNSKLYQSYMRQQATGQGVTVNARLISSAEQLFPALDELLESNDVLLAVPDIAIYNSLNIRNILLSTYRSGIPFIGLSQSYVTAGALGAIYSSTEQVSSQVAATILGYARSGVLPDPQYPHEFSFSLNPEVARSLGIELPADELVRQRINRANRVEQ